MRLTPRVTIFKMATGGFSRLELREGNAGTKVEKSLNAYVEKSVKIV